jgi:hypothetical protein
MFAMKDAPPPFNVVPALAGITPAVVTAAIAATEIATLRRSFIFVFPPGFMCCPDKKSMWGGLQQSHR